MSRKLTVLEVNKIIADITLPLLNKIEKLNTRLDLIESRLITIEKDTDTTSIQSMVNDFNRAQTHFSPVSPADDYDVVTFSNTY